LQSLADDLLGFTNTNLLAMLTFLADTCAITKMIWMTTSPSSAFRRIQIRPSKRFHRSCCQSSSQPPVAIHLGYRHSQSPQDLREICVLDIAVLNGVQAPWPIAPMRISCRSFVSAARTKKRNKDTDNFGHGINPIK
jgi:hypothetical protein